MFIVLHESRGRLKIVSREVISQNVNKFCDDRNSIFAYYNTFHFDGADLRVPIMRTNVSNRYSFSWICV